MRPLPAWLHSPRVVAGLLIIGLIAVAAVLAPLLAPNDPQEQHLVATLLPPAWSPGGDAAFPLGTDSLGRCEIGRAHV